MDEIRRMIHFRLKGVAPTLCGAMLCVFFVSGSFAQESGELEYRIKAAQIYWFANLIHWPREIGSGSEQEIHLCVLGKDPFGDSLNSLIGKDIQGRKLTVSRVENVDNLPECHILFIAPSEQLNWPAILEKIRAKPILTVGDFEGFAHTGGILNFVRAENKVRFKVNLNAARKAGITVSSRLIRSALEVIEEKNNS